MVADAVSNALGKVGCTLHDIVYQEHALGAWFYLASHRLYWHYLGCGQAILGMGFTPDIIAASVYALFSAVNRMLNDQTEEK